MADKTIVQFIGTRRRDFTVLVNGRRYYVQPGKPLAVEKEDAGALVERDPHLWQPVEETPERVNPARRKVED